jgi:hypothetical protein
MPNIAVATDSPVAETTVEYNEQIALLCEQLLRTQTHMKKKADRNRSEHEFQVGDEG